MGNKKRQIKNKKNPTSDLGFNTELILGSGPAASEQVLCLGV